MKVSFYNNISHTSSSQTESIISILEKIKSGHWRKQIEGLRKLSKADQKKEKNKLPNFTASGTFTEAKDKCLIFHSGLVQIDIDGQNSEELKNQLRSDKYIFSLFDSPTQTGLKALVKIPTVDHKASYDALVNYFADKYGISIDKSCRNIARRFFVSYDPDLYLNEQSEVFSEIQMDQPLKNESYSDKGIDKEDFISALNSFPSKQKDDGKRDHYNLIIWTVKTVLGESEAERIGKRLLADSSQINDISQILRAGRPIDHPEWIFKEAEKQGWVNPKKGIKKKKHLYEVPKSIGNNAVQVDPAQYNFDDSLKNKYAYIRNSLNASYNFRRNILTETVDMSEKTDGQWVNCSDIEVNDLIQKLNEDENIDSQAVNIVLNSSFAKPFNPIKDYFESLDVGKVDKQRPDKKIQELYEFITGRKAEENESEFNGLKTWLCAHAGISIDESENVDQLYCLCFYGKQGTGKSSLTRYFSPTCLRSYFKENLTDYESKDTKIALGENFLIQLDELGESSRHELVKLKSLITQKQIKERRPHAKRDTFIKRRAAFIGSFDKAEVFEDSAGNRRFIVIEIQKIDWKKLAEHPIDDVWTEALYLYRQGLYSKTIDAGNVENNKAFEKSDPAIEAIQACFDLASSGSYLTATQILAVINENMKIAGLSTHKIGSALKKLGIEKRSVRLNGASTYAYPITAKDGFLVLRGIEPENVASVASVASLEKNKVATGNINQVLIKNSV